MTFTLLEMTHTFPLCKWWHLISWHQDLTMYLINSRPKIKINHLDLFTWDMTQNFKQLDPMTQNYEILNNWLLIEENITWLAKLMMSFSTYHMITLAPQGIETSLWGSKNLYSSSSLYPLGYRVIIVDLLQTKNWKPHAHGLRLFIYISLL